MSEIDKIKESFEAGELEPLEKQLQVFIQSNKEQIFKFKSEEEKKWNRELHLEFTIKLYILYLRSIDVESEMKDQIKILEEHKVIHGNDPAIQNAECINWIKKHASMWRGYRVLSIIYVFDRKKDHFLSLLQ